MMRKGWAFFIAIIMVAMCLTALAEPAGVPDGESNPVEQVELEKTADEPEKPAPIKKIKGSVTVRIVNKGNICIGDSVTLEATVKGVGQHVAYELRWEFYDGKEWQTVKDETFSEYTFTVTEENCGYQWRAVAVIEA